MSSVAVCDASSVVALLIDAGETGSWVAERFSGMELAAPALMPFEAANILRRHLAAKLIGVDQAAQAHADLLDLDVELWPYEVLAPRAWELKANLTTYDGSYVALAEMLGTSLITLDHKIGRVRNLACKVEVPR